MVWKPAEGGETLSAEAWAAGEIGEELVVAAVEVADGLVLEAAEVAEELVAEAVEEAAELDTIEEADELVKEAVEVAEELVIEAVVVGEELVAEAVVAAASSLGKRLWRGMPAMRGLTRKRAGPVAPPLRTCIGCRRVAPVSELFRIVHAGDGGLAVGLAHPGRGRSALS